MIRVLSVIGTRPEAIKMAPVVRELERWPDEIAPRVCVTAQHRDLLDSVLDLFGIVPDHDLDIMRADQTSVRVMAEIFTRLTPVLETERPDWVLVQGDTTTVLAAALLAHFHQIRIGHVEAGLRTHDRLAPFPEEMNRTLVSPLAHLHFAPTETARQHLLREGIADEAILITGNPVIDALRQVIEMPCDLEARLPAIPWDRDIVFITAHRRESFGEPLADICRALRRLADDCPRAHFVYPVHPNPRVHGPVTEALAGHERITLLDPTDYLTTAHLMKRARLILTDSGGLQEEGPALGTPVLVLRRVTERPEAVEAGTVALVGTDPETIVRDARRLLDDAEAHAAMARAINPYGDGHAAEQIVAALRDTSPRGEL